MNNDKKTESQLLIQYFKELDSPDKTRKKVYRAACLYFEEKHNVKPSLGFFRLRTLLLEDGYKKKRGLMEYDKKENNGTKM